MKQILQGGLGDLHIDRKVASMEATHGQRYWLCRGVTHFSVLDHSLPDFVTGIQTY